MKDLKYYKRLEQIFALTVFVLAIANLVYICIAVARSHDISDLHCIISLSLFGALAVTTAVIRFILNAKKQRLTDSLYGKVSESDRALASSLAKRVEELYSVSYDFLDNDYDDKYFYNPKSLKMWLKHIAKDNKIDADNVATYLEIAKAIEQAPEKDDERNARFNAYVKELAGLLERNTVKL